MKFCFGLILPFVCFVVYVTGSNLLDIEAENSVHNVFARSIEERQQKCVCGEGGSKRIVGGTVAKNHHYPWMVALLLGNKLFCGGAVINDQYILTAAHCFAELSRSEFKSMVLLIGENNIDKPIKEDALQMGVKSVIMHENYGEKYEHDNDIALLKVNGKIPFSDNIQPICLTSANADYLEKLGTVAGWGFTAYGGKTISDMLEVSLPVISDDICKNNYSFIGYDRDTMMCAGYLDGSKDACTGDSGGPFFIQDDDGAYVVFGISSFGYRCGEPGFPGVYTRLSTFLPWIAKKTEDANYCKRPTTE